jgi:hypothetical protein
VKYHDFHWQKEGPGHWSFRIEDLNLFWKAEHGHDSTITTTAFMDGLKVAETVFVRDMEVHGGLEGTRVAERRSFKQVFTLLVG